MSGAMKTTETVPARLWSSPTFDGLRDSGTLAQGLYLLSTWRKNPTGIFRLTVAEMQRDVSPTGCAPEGALLNLQKVPDSFLVQTTPGWVWVRPMSAVQCGWPKCSSSDRSVLTGHLLESPEALVRGWLEQYGEAYEITTRGLGFEPVGGTPAPSNYTPCFLDFWELYPKKHNKAAAAREASKLVNAEHGWSDIMDGLEIWLVSKTWQQGYVHNADRWLRDLLWKEVPDSRPSPDSPRGGLKPWQRKLGDA